MEFNKEDIVLYRGIANVPTKGRVRRIYDSCRIGVWRKIDGHYVIIDPTDIIFKLEKEEWKI